MLLEYLKKYKNYFIYAAVSLILVSLIARSAVLLSQKSCYKGISIDGMDVGGLEKDEVGARMQKLRSEYLNGFIILRYEDKSWKLMLSDIDFYLEDEKAVLSAYEMGHKGNLISRLYSIARLKFKKADINVDVYYDEIKLVKALAEIGTQIQKEKKNAEVLYKNGNVSVNKEENGLILDIDATKKIIENNIVNKNFSDVELVVENLIPDITYNMVSGIDSVLASFSTTFNAQDVNRTYNIKLACSRINNTVLMPGDIFSMDRGLGARTLENGYKDAPVIFKNELVTGPGGGVCQVTTTLYGAVLRSCLEVIERSPHSLPLGYVDPGQDATIAENYIDFKFQNNKSEPVCISADVSGNSLNIRILGKRENTGYSVRIRSVILGELEPQGEEIIIDDSLPDNEKQIVKEAKKGLKVAVYRDICKKTGEIVSSEKISEDSYYPVKAQVKVNSRYANKVAGKK